MESVGQKEESPCVFILVILNVQCLMTFSVLSFFWHHTYLYKNLKQMYCLNEMMAMEQFV